MASMVPYRFPMSIRPMSSWFDALDDLASIADSRVAGGAFPMDVEDAGDSYVVKAYLAGVGRDEIDVELNEGRLSIAVNVEDKEEDKGKNYLAKEFVSYSATRGVYLKDAACDGLTAKLTDGVLTVNVPKMVEKKNVTKISID